jgi:hypothetical protein
MNGVRGSAFVEPEWVVVHTKNYQEIPLLRDTAGQFLGGGPFMGPYGSGSNLQASGQLGGPIDSIWNKQVYVSAAVGAGTALVGSRAAGQVWSRGGPDRGSHQLAFRELCSRYHGDPRRAQVGAHAVSADRAVRGALGLTNLRFR